MQEVAFPRLVTLICGDVLLDWDDTARTLDFAVRNSMLDIFMPTSSRPAYEAISRLGYMRRCTQQCLRHMTPQGGAETTPWVMALQLRGLGASDPRDNLFALTGLVENLGGAILFQPNYHEEVSEVYTAFMRNVIAIDGDLRFLKCVESWEADSPESVLPFEMDHDYSSSASSTSSDLLLRLSRTPSLNSIASELPSWVINWNKQTVLHPIENTRFCAALNSQHNVRPSTDLRQLLVRGIRVDTFRMISPPLQLRDSGLSTFHTWKSLVRRHTRRAGINFHSNWQFDAAFAATMRAGATSFTKDSQSPYDGPPLRSEIDEQKFIDLLDLLDSKMDVENVMKQHFLADAVLGELYTVLERTCRRRKVVVTCDGKTGLVPQSTQKEDSLFVLQGSDVPFVLRNEWENHWSLVGHCYLHRSMFGEDYDSKLVGDVVLV